MTTLEETLAHFGVKGMHWGVRRSSTMTHPAPSADAQRAATSKKIAKSGGTKALSNADLQHLVTRLNLERQLSQIAPSNKQKAIKFATDLLVGVGKQEVTKLATNVVAKQVASALKK